MQPQQLYAAEVTPSSFRLAWPPLLTFDSGYYVLELVPSADRGATRRQQLPGNATDWTWAGLNPDSEYDVALLPESNVHLLKPQHLRVRTLPGEARSRGTPVLGCGWVCRVDVPLLTPHPPSPQTRPVQSASSSHTRGRAASA